MIGLGLNLALAIVWFLLGDPPTAQRFFVGYFAGFLVVFLGRRALPGSRYTERTAAFAVFLLRFAVALVKANLHMAGAILVRPRSRMNPVLVDYPVGDLTKAEILILSHSITLTPGTVTVSVAKDFRVLRIHAFDGGDPERIVEEIRRNLEGPILAFTR